MQKYTYTFLFRLEIGDGVSEQVEIEAANLIAACAQLNLHVKAYAEQGEIVTEVYDILNALPVPQHRWNELPATPIGQGVTSVSRYANRRTAQYLASAGKAHVFSSTYKNYIIAAAKMLVQSRRSEWRYLTTWQSGTTCWESGPTEIAQRKTCTVSATLEIRD